VAAAAPAAEAARAARQEAAAEEERAAPEEKQEPQAWAGRRAPAVVPVQLEAEAPRARSDRAASADP
jgi:hypothetical protein